MYLITEWRLRDIFDIFVLLRRVTLCIDFWPFDLDIDSYAVPLMPDHLPILIIVKIGYRLLSYDYFIAWSHIRYREHTNHIKM